MQDFNSIIQQYHPVLYKISRAYTDKDMDFEDLYQEMLIQLWQSLKNFKGQSKLSTWIYQVVLNTALSYNRQRKRVRQLLPLQAMPAQLVAEESTHQDREKEITLLYQCIRELKKSDRSIILLHLEGKSYDEIAEITGLSKSNVGVKLNRTKKRLFTLLKANGYGRI
ncbi:MAG: sigma-70 family RNA polymerase sigma factor [Bacteroidota bacterium]